MCVLIDVAITVDRNVAQKEAMDKKPVTGDNEIIII
jgi:hypothetical protein